MKEGNGYSARSVHSKCHEIRKKRDSKRMEHDEGKSKLRSWCFIKVTQNELVKKNKKDVKYVERKGREWITVLIDMGRWLASSEGMTFAFYWNRENQLKLGGKCTMVENSQEYRLKYWATRSSICSFARTAHLFARSRLLALLAPSAALTHSLAHSSLVGK